MPRIRKTLESITETLKKWKVAIYIRLSKDDGNDESYSVANQRERLVDYLNDLMEAEDAEFVDYYIDDGETGVDSDREHFQRLLADVRSKRIDCIIVKDADVKHRLNKNFKFHEIHKHAFRLDRFVVQIAEHEPAVINYYHRRAL
jgi:DNA invertase Pin-like site-specific DNA recombinase